MKLIIFCTMLLCSAKQDSVSNKTINSSEIFIEAFGAGSYYSLNYSSNFKYGGLNRIRIGTSIYYDYLIHSSKSSVETLFILGLERLFLRDKKKMYLSGGFGTIFLPDFNKIFNTRNYYCPANVDGICSPFPIRLLYASFGMNWLISEKFKFKIEAYGLTDFNKIYPYAGISIGKLINTRSYEKK